MNKEQKDYYMAGVLDSEGYIGIQKNHKREQVSPYYHERVAIGMRSGEIIKMFYDKFSGYLAYRKNTSKIGKQNDNYWAWEVSDKKATLVCEYFVNKLIEKKEQAQLVLKLRESKNRGQLRRKKSKLLKQRILDERDLLYNRIINIHGRKKSNYWKEKL